MKYPEGRILEDKKESDDIVSFNRSQLINIPGFTVENPSIQNRAGGEFKDVAIYLDPIYSWVIIKDNHRSLCLVPYKEEAAK